MRLSSTSLTNFKRRMSPIKALQRLLSGYALQEVSCPEEAWAYLKQLTSTTKTDSD